MSVISGSDDTDILLVIPPDYFLNNADKQLQKGQQYQQHKSAANQQYQSEFPPMSDTKDQFGSSKNYHGMHQLLRQSLDAYAMPPPGAPTSAYMFLPKEQKVELSQINTRLHELEQREHEYGLPSDISTISNGTVRCRDRTDAYKLVHSTPKCGGSKCGHGNVAADNEVLHEIDDFFEEQLGRRHSDGQKSQQQHCVENKLSAQEGQVLTSSLPDALNRLSLQQTTKTPTDSNLVSLSEIWGRSGQATAIATTGSSATHFSLKEEQLRRQHLEKTVHLLQSRILEYQQRLSVAIEVDRAKDGALSNAQADCKSLHAESQRLRDALLKSETQQQEHVAKLELLQQELAQALQLAGKYQQKHEQLEGELAANSRKITESVSVYRKQLEEFELKMHASKRAEEFVNVELQKVRDKYANADYQSEKLKTRCHELEQELSKLREQKDTLQELQQKQKSRADLLETQKKSLQDMLKQYSDNESALKLNLELQQKSLKSHYQQQLEHVVGQKLKEFQAQLDKIEETFKSESRERERLLAERAVKQLELISEKSDIELNLLQEKHDEEVSLYRIQLANASKKIDELEAKLNCYKTKRADMAEKLHDVMEAQWQKALEILTSPNQCKQTRNNGDVDSPENNESNGNFETPKSSKHRRNKNNKENNLNAGKCKQQQNSEQLAQTQPIDRVQAYIELLLSKSPSDFEKLTEILALSKKTHNVDGKLSKSASKRNGKPPWKA